MKLYVYECWDDGPFNHGAVIAARTPTEAREMMMEENTFAKKATARRCDRVYAKGNPHIIASWSD